MQNPLRYPLADIHEQTDYLQIGITKYVSIGDNNGSSDSLTGTAGSRRIKNNIERIYLPIPSNIQDGNSVTYGDSSLNSIAGAAVGGIVKTMVDGNKFVDESGNFSMREGMDTLGSNIGQTLGKIVAASGGKNNLAGFLTRKFASSAVGILGANVTPSQILARQTGQILNPNLELLFDKPTLRNFRFSFNMVARSQEEGEQIKQIIRLLKKSMAPIVEGNTFLKTPKVFELRYKQGKDNHKFLNQFKQCFLTDISVNYTGSGTYATYDNGTPVSIKMDLSFKEIEPIYNTDYEDDNDFKTTGVGY